MPDICKCGTEMIIKREWLGADAYEMLGYDFHVVTACPKRNIFNFWKHTGSKCECRVFIK